MAGSVDLEEVKKSSNKGRGFVAEYKAKYMQLQEVSGKFAIDRDIYRVYRSRYRSPMHTGYIVSV